jgi:PKD repeat protein
MSFNKFIFSFILFFLVFSSNVFSNISNVNVVCNTGYISGSKTIVWFTISGVNYYEEWGTYLELEFPSGITPTGVASDPLAEINYSEYGQEPAYLNGVIGNSISWGDQGTYFGGIEDGEHLFFVEVEVDPGITGSQTINYTIYGDGYGDEPHVYSANFSMEEIFSCSQSSDLSAITIDANTAKLSWNYGSTPNCNLEWGPKGFQRGSGNFISLSTNPVEISGLSPDSIYDFYVQDSCGIGMVSEWQGPVSFATLFSELDLGIPGFGYGFVSFSDLDGDKDLDIIILGEDNSCIYRNDNNDIFNRVELGIEELLYGSAALADYDNDGDIDFINTGYLSSTEKISKIYRNDGGLVFTKVNADLIGVYSSTVGWGDIDNDGDPDLYIAGTDNDGKEIAQLYLNEGDDIFTPLSSNLVENEVGTVLFGDYNNDEYIDLFTSGYNRSGNRYSALYKNNGDLTFTDISPGFLPSGYNQAAFGDFDSDMDLDILICGYTDSSKTRTRIYWNEGFDTFNEDANPLIEYTTRSYAVGDYNNDGRTDILLTATDDESKKFSKVFLNDGAGSFTDSYATLLGNHSGTVASGDYDNDGDLDLLIGGAYVNTIIYKNNCSVANTKPTIPQNLSFKEIAFGANLSWDMAADEESENASLSYNLRIGTSIDSFNILAPLADTMDGFRQVNYYGNAYLDTSFILQNIDTGKYYWAVQAIDNGFLASDFSEIDSFVVKGYFTDIYNGIDSIRNISWGDYDNDDDLDIVADGRILNGFNISKIYRNNGNNTFTEVIYSGDTLLGEIKWGDYDNDGDLDLYMSGYKYPSIYDYSIVIPKSKIYRNDGNNIFIDIDAGLVNICFSSGAWGDIDNDGDLDIVVSGASRNYPDYKPLSRIYINEGKDVFTQFDPQLADLFFSSLTLVDFNNDGYLDIFINGEDSLENRYAILYSNNGDLSFSEINSNIWGSNSGSSSWGDYDGDGDLDLIVTGQDISDNYHSIIYRNDGNNTFTDIKANLLGISSGTGNWGDYDNDGDLDILLTGRNRTLIANIYLNKGGDVFEELDFNLSKIGIYKSYWGDYDNDSDLDFFGPSYYFDGLFRNNYNEINTPPQKPGNLRVEFLGENSIFKWDNAPDLESEGKGLSYNIRLGISPGGEEIISPMSNLINGFRKIPEMGNAQAKTFYLVKDLPPGYYYWSVQAIDQSYAGGEWADEQTIYVSDLRADFFADTVCLSSATQFTNISFTTGEPILSNSWDFGDGHTSDFSDPEHIFASPGIYIVKLKVETASNSDSISKNILVKEKPLVLFNADHVCQGEQTSFVNETTMESSSVHSWKWDLGDGTDSFLETPLAHGYLNRGDYQVKLVAIADNGCSDSITKIISVGSYPVAGITSSGNPEFCSGDSIVLSNTYHSTYAYQWQIGSVDLNEADSSKLVVSMPGSYTVKVTNPIGNCISISDPVNVSVFESPTSPAIYINGPTTFCSGDSVTLSVTENPPLTYQWKLNGGAVGGNTAIYVAKSTGDYSVDVSNAEGCVVSSVNEVEVTVNASPQVPQVDLSDVKRFCEGGTLTMSVSDPGTESYQWYNELGAVPGASATELTVDESGYYRVRARNTQGCEVYSKEVDVIVDEPPVSPVVLAANYLPGGCPSDDPVTLSVESAEGDVAYSWLRNGVFITAATGDTYMGYLDEADYSVRAVRNTCSAESAPLTISYGEIPEKPGIIAEGPSIWYLACSNDSATQYRWYYEGELIDGADEYLYVAGTQLGRYEVAISEEGSCYAKSDAVWIPLTGIEEDPWENLKIYPNPTPGLFTLEMNNPIMGELIIDIFRETGAKIINIKFHKETVHFKTQIDLSGQPPAAYLIGLMLKQHATQRRVVVY